MSENDEDVRLIREIGRGDDASLVRLMERHKVAVFRFVYRYLGNEEDCREVTEETFFRVFQRAHAFKPRAAVKTWIFSIALNLSRDRLRRRKKFRWQVSFDAPASEPGNGVRIEAIDSGSADPRAELGSSEALDRIQSRIHELPEKLRFPFVFCVLEEHPYDECAEVLQVSRKTVETRIYRARQALRSALRKDFAEN